jgi:hypothetical protein
MKLWTATLYLLARWEVTHAPLGEQISEATDCEDLLPSNLIPSVALDERLDRVLADIDQDGFIFAVAERDAQFFNTRNTMVPRRHHRVQIVLTGGFVRIRKTVLRKANAGIIARIHELLQWEFYLEAAALLRLRGLAGVPSIRRVDPCQGVIEMDYIWGPDLRQVLIASSSHIDYTDVHRRFHDVVADPDNELSQQISQLLINVMNRGVIPRDIDAENFIRARHSAKVYLIDFNLAYLRPIPGWQSHARNVASILRAHPGSGK